MRPLNINIYIIPRYSIPILNELNINIYIIPRYSVVILDEAHERTVHTDILLGVVKMAQKKRREQNKPLRIVVMSATLNPEQYSSYFGDAKILYIEGRQHPVQVS